MQGKAFQTPTPLLWRSSRTPSSRALGPCLGGGWAPSVVDRQPTAGRTLASSAGSSGPRWRPRELGLVCVRGGRSPARPEPVPSPSPPAGRAAAKQPPSQPAPPLRSADRRRQQLRRVGRGQVWAAGLRGLGGQDPGRLRSIWAGTPAL